MREGAIPLIVRQEAGQLVITAQPEHARASGVFAAAWGGAGWARPEPYATVLRATIHHDDGWLPYEMTPRVHPESHLPCNFRGSPFGIGQIPDHRWAVRWISAVDRYAGMLVGAHRTGLPQQRYGVLAQPPMGAGRALPSAEEGFLRETETERDRWLPTVDGARFWVNYHLLQVWDVLSLYLCESSLQETVVGPVPMGYGQGAARADLTLTPLDPRTIRVEPYPFDQAPLSVPLLVRRLPATPYASDEEFQAAYFARTPEVLEFVFRW